MTDQPKKKPLARIFFAAKIGKDQYGQDLLGPLREIGSVWPRKDASKGNLIRFDLDVANMRDGVTFEIPYTDKDQAEAPMPSEAGGDYEAPAF